jgi:oligopeptide transport system substrate-binding protein
MSVAVLSACRNASDGSDYVFVIDLEVNPRTLDPQTAVDRTAQQIISNIFDGLLRMDESGNVVPGVASDYTVSEDLLTYTFRLREDVYWSDPLGFHTICTAHDFVFGFERLFNPEVRSLNSSDYFSIANARQIREGELPLTELGVSAKDDFTLIIQLEQPDSNLPVLLTMPPAFPANRDFFKQSEGRYGLIYAESALASNGAFILQEWVHDPHWYYENRIILSRNESNNNTGQFGRIYPRRIDFLMDRGRALDNFINGNTNCIVISGDSAAGLISRGFPYSGVENSVWGIGFNTSGVFRNEDLRRSLALAADSMAAAINQTGVTAASSLVPDSIRIGDGVPDSIPPDPAEAAALYRGVSHLVVVNPVLIVPVASENDVILSQVHSIVQQWQNHLGMFCQIDVLSPEEFAQRFADGDYDIAAVNVTATYNSPSAVLEPVLAWSGGGNSDAARHIRRAKEADSPETIAQHFLNAESSLLQAAEFIPFCFVTEYFFTDHDSTDLVYNPFTGGIIFRNGKSM